MNQLEAKRVDYAGNGAALELANMEITANTLTSNQRMKDEEAIKSDRLGDDDDELLMTCQTPIIDDWVREATPLKQCKLAFCYANKLIHLYSSPRPFLIHPIFLYSYV